MRRNSSIKSVAFRRLVFANRITAKDASYSQKNARNIDVGFFDILAQSDCVYKDKALISALFVAIVVSPPFKTQYRNL